MGELVVVDGAAKVADVPVGAEPGLGWSPCGGGMLLLAASGLPVDDAPSEAPEHPPIVRLSARTVAMAIGQGPRFTGAPRFREVLRPSSVITIKSCSTKCGRRSSVTSFHMFGP